MFYYRKLDYPQRKHIRLRGHDYGSDGFYSITICTKNITEYFGEIRNGVMGLNELGLIAHEYWKEIPQHFNNVILDEFVIMPDHIHGILILENDKRNKDFEKKKRNEEMGNKALFPHRTGVAMQRPYDEEKNHSYRLFSQNPDPYFSPISPKSKSIPTIIRSYKSAVSKKIHQDYPEANFYWHRSYHDRIIRDEEELLIKRRYIQNNPRKWEK